MSSESKILIGIGLITLVIVGAGVILLSRQKPQTQSQQIDQNALLSGARHTIGKASAAAKVVEFGDYQCPACGTAFPIIKDILDKNGSKIYFAFINFPLPIHQNAKAAAQAAEAAGAQGKYFEMHDKLYETQKDWENSSNPGQIFEGFAQQLGLNIDKYKEDFKNSIADINKDVSLGDQFSVNTTPTFFINGTRYLGVIDAGQFQQIIDQAK